MMKIRQMTEWDTSPRQESKLTGKKPQYILSMITVMMVFLLAVPQDASAHGRTTIPVTLPNGETRTITFVMGHSNEPTHAAEPGIHDGNHPMEVFLRDSATSLDISSAELKADKFYFKDIKEFNRASSPYNARSIERDIPVNPVHGEPGNFVTHQIHSDSGIYGYRVTGTISYFGVAEASVEITAFCRDATPKFNSEGWSGGFGCTENINNIMFPKKAGHRTGQFGS